MVEYECEKCHCLWNDAKRWAAVRDGEWRPTAESTMKNIAGFWIWEAYSPWVRLSKIVQDFLGAKDNRERLKVFVNTSLGESWEETGDVVDDNILYTRRENYPAEVPKGGLVITSGVDVQDDRLEMETVAFGIGEESWSVEYFIIQGNPGLDQVWKDLEDAIDKYYIHESGIKIKSSCICIDSGGHFTEQVYKFCKGREIKRIFATKGSNIAGRPLISRPSINNKYRIKLYMIGTDTGKQTLFSRLKMTDVGAGYMHFPLKHDEEYFKQLTAEKMTTKYSYGFPTRVWVKTRARNEVLDCRIGAMAALAILNPNFEKIAKSYENIKSETGNKNEQDLKEQKKLMRRNKGWVNNWKM
jgi:phage terminase large subunit GpA-like protein